MRMIFDLFHQLVNSQNVVIVLHVTVPHLFNHFQHVRVSMRNVLDSCLDTGSPELFGSASDIIMFFLFESFSIKKVRSRISSFHIITNFLAHETFGMGRFVAYCICQHQNPNRTSNFLCMKLSVMVNFPL